MPGCGGIMDASAAMMIEAAAGLNEQRIITMHGGDREISGLREMTLSKIANIDRPCNGNRARGQADTPAPRPWGRR